MLSSLRPVRRCKEPVYTVDISPDGTRYLWAGGSPGEECAITVCAVASNEVLHSLVGHKKPVVHARFLDDGGIVSFSFDSHMCRWTPDGTLDASNNIHKTHRADGFAVGRDGRLAVVADYRGGITGWRLTDIAKSFMIKDNTRGLQLWSVSLHPDGKRLLSGGAEGKIRVWSLARKQQLAAIDLGWGQHVHGLSWHPDGGTFVVASAPDGAAPAGSQSRVTHYHGSKLREIRSFLPGGNQPLCSAFSRDGRMIAAAGGGTDAGSGASKTSCVIHVWKVASGEDVAVFSGHTQFVRDLAFSPDGQWLLSAGWDCSVRVWRIGS